MVKLGMLMADRYEILEKIGTGGMSDVYKAKDHKLNRFVAVKVLKQEFSENANFVSKFRVEAQAAAGLMHPNIVNVYDVGQEEGIHFIVMELVVGRTLKAYIEKKARLSYNEAISIAIQVCRGIGAAHNNHIIHRDIKPQNIIISKEGKVKVTDFGIAKAATSNTITSNVMGSVHYTSPEQARGGYSDERSDIYSLGVTLFEMLTGRVPFNGETTVAIAIKHIQEEMPSPRDFVSEIPLVVEQIVFKCCQKSPDRRYQSMDELMEDLKKALMNPDSQIDMDQNEKLGATRSVDDEEIGRIRKQAKSREALDEAVVLRTEKESRNKSMAGNSADKNKPRKKTGPVKKVYQDDWDDEEDDDYGESGSKDPNMEKITTLIAIVAAILVGLIVVFIIAKALGVFDFGKSKKDKSEGSEIETVTSKIEMIEVVGQKAETIKKALIEAGLTPEIEYEESSEYEKGIVVRSSVAPGEMVDEGSNVILTVSVGETGVEVPDVVGMTEAEAVATLVGKGFTPSKTEGYDDFIQAGSIYKQSPEGNGKAPAGETVTIFISKGPEQTKVSVPDLKGKDQVAAVALLEENGLKLGTVSEVYNNDPSLEGKICAQSVPAGSYLDAESAIDVSISIGPEKSTYKFIESIQAPTAEEDPNYRDGTMVTVTMKDANGTVLLSTQTTSFPIAEQNITGIITETGTILFQYANEGESSTITNEDGSISINSSPAEEKDIVRTITFIEE